VDEMQHRKFDGTQLKALKEFLPTVDERQGLKMFMKKGESDPETKEKLYKELSECEKYMYTMADVPNAAAKFDCMLFRNQFKIRFEDIIEAISTVEAACDETRNSERLRMMMATILTLVNQINTGGEGNEAQGFSLDALLKLNEVRGPPFIFLPFILASFTANAICVFQFRFAGESFRQKDQRSHVPCQTCQEE